VSLNDILGRLIEQFEPEGSAIQMHAAIMAGRAIVLKDREITIYLIDEGLGRHLTLKSTRTLGGKRKKSDLDDARQTNMFQFFGLRPRYALDDEERNVKRTDWLTRAEVNKLLEIRRKQLDDDLRHYELLRSALDSVAPLWDLHPDYNFGQIIELYLKQQKEAA
jgi:hypothetical protein